MVERVIGVLLLGVVALGIGSGCTGGCYVEAEKVQTSPKTDCLSLFAGQSASDPTVCAVPQLGGTNNCGEALTLPKRSDGDEPQVVAPGAEVAWPVPASSVEPGVLVTQRGSDARTYTIMATLGDTPVTIIVPVHDD